MQLLGVGDENIVHDYALTTVGLQPAFPLLALRFQKEDAFRNNWKGVISLGTAKCVNFLFSVCLIAWSMQGLIEMTDRPESMRDVLKVIETEFGGVEEYVRQMTSLTSKDFERIRRNLLVPVIA